MIRAAITLTVTVFVLTGCSAAREPIVSSSADTRAADVDGQRIFAAYCSGCHQPDGGGVEGGPPPLMGSEWLTGPDGRIIRVVLHGMRGPVEVRGQTYNLEMPSFGPVLSDDQIAAVLNFVRARFSDSRKMIVPSSVAEIRAATADRTVYWTAGELLQID